MSRLTVCIATLNGEKYIQQQLESILPQLHENDEVIISDDGSTDKTINIIQSFNDGRIKIVENNSIKGYVFNFENALKHAKGEYIFLSDQDDRWMNNKVSISLRYLKQYDLIVSDCIVVDKDLNVIHQSYFDLVHSGKGLVRNIYKCTYMGCCMAFKRSVLKKALPFPPHTPMHDGWLGLVAELYFKPCFIQEKLVMYRRHDRNMSTTGEKSTNSLLTKIKIRTILLLNLVRRCLAQGCRERKM